MEHAYTENEGSPLIKAAWLSNQTAETDLYKKKKQKGKFRPLSIPVMLCRGQQALHLLSLEPVAEISADKNAYGFRPLRSTADAIEQCFVVLSRKSSAPFILEGDIQACFDCISHSFLEENVIMDKQILKKWLAAGYMEKGKLHSTTRGTPQGGIISPTLLNVTLSGLEAAVKAATKQQDKVNMCCFADDFIITGATKEVLENKVKPVVEIFLSERGLSLSQEKTKITHINEGFNFQRLLTDIREIIKRNKTVKTEILIWLLNPKIRGWANYYRNVCSKATFSYVDHHIFKAIWRWAKRRHPNKGLKWVKRRYFHHNELRQWVFSTQVKNKDGKTVDVSLVEASKVPIKRHIKIKAEATPYNKTYHQYFDKLIAKRKIVRGSTTVSNCWLCWWKLLAPYRRMKRPGRLLRPYKDLSRVKGNFHARFLWELHSVTGVAYQAKGV